MDFSNLLNTITGFFSDLPTSFFGIDTMFIGIGLLIALLFSYTISKALKTKPKRELSDLFPNDVEKEDNEDEESISQEDGFMPTSISNDTYDIHVSDEPEYQEVEATPTTAPIQETEETPIPPARKADTLVRKKRKATREGRKISKADFSDFSGQRLLIAEDNLINQKVINGVLNESGIEVVMADDGQFVMDILENDSDFEIILMDAHMPRVDGFEATRMIRENEAYDHIAVVALSGDTAVDDIRHMTEAGMEEHLEKPLKMDSLYDIMSMYYSMDEVEEETVVEEESINELEISVDVSELACLDYDSGLEICGNDEKMYRELLKEFFLGYKNSSKRMREALVNKDYKEAQSILVDVKGTASNLGAVQFIACTEQFLQALANEDKASYGKLFKDYQSYLLALLKSIQAAFKK
ncbi:response regulator [Sulfurimonas sp. MAG313]|nr:response regulator [Sulfurimonas sp. MAG313]MDF1881938.1 response regulator [Sulfurimonas sp. MAG313]